MTGLRPEQASILTHERQGGSLPGSGESFSDPRNIGKASLNFERLGCSGITLCQG